MKFLSLKQCVKYYHCFYKDGEGIKSLMKVDMPLNKDT